MTKLFSSLFPARSAIAVKTTVNALVSELDEFLVDQEQYHQLDQEEDLNLSEMIT